MPVAVREDEDAASDLAEEVGRLSTDGSQARLGLLLITLSSAGTLYGFWRLGRLALGY